MSWEHYAKSEECVARIKAIERQLAEAHANLLRMTTNETLQMQRAIRAEDRLAEARGAIETIANKTWPALGHINPTEFAIEWLKANGGE